MNFRDPWVRPLIVIGLVVLAFLLVPHLDRFLDRLTEKELLELIFLVLTLRWL